MERVRIGIIGCGGIAGAHVKNGYRRLREAGCDHIEITAVCDLVADSTARFQRDIAEFQGQAPQAFASVEALLAAGVVDGVDVCTVHADHHVTAVRCLEAGVHVLIEKPLGVTLRAARVIQAAAEASGCVLSVAENSRRGLGQRAMTWAFRRKQLGEPRLFSIESFTGPALPRPAATPPEPVDAVRWRADRLQAGGGWTYDGGVHLMDSLRLYFGDVDTVYAEHRTLVPRVQPLTGGGEAVLDGEDTCIAALRFAGGVIGHWTWSQVLPGIDHSRVAFYCSDGWVLDETPGGWTHTFGGGFIPSQAHVHRPDGSVTSGRDLEVEYLLHLADDERERLFPHGVQHGMAAECHEFVDCIRHGRRPEVDAEEGIQGLAISAALYESAAAGAAVRVADVLSGEVDAYQRPIDEHWGLVR